MTRFDFAFLAVTHQDFDIRLVVLSTTLVTTAMRTLFVLLLVTLALAKSGFEHPEAEVCTAYFGFQQFAPDPATEVADEDEFVYPEESMLWVSGGIPAPIGEIQNIICDMENTMMWKAEYEYNMFWLSPNSARCHFNDLSHEWQIMETHCLFDQFNGIYTQVIYNEEDHALVSRQVWTFAQEHHFTSVNTMAYYPDYTVENAMFYYHLDEEDDGFDEALDILEGDLYVEAERIFTLATDHHDCDDHHDNDEPDGPVLV